MQTNFYALPIRQILEEAWLKVYGVKKAFFAAFVSAFLIIITLLFLEDKTEVFLAHPIYAILTFSSSLINFLLIAGVTYLGIHCAFNKPISYREPLAVFKPKIAINVLGIYFLKLLINCALIFIGFLFLSGIGFLITLTALMLFIQVRLILALAFVLDKKVNAWAALKLSFKATQYQFWRLFLLVIIQVGLLFILSFLTFGLALIWTIPYVMITYGLVYKNLLAQLENRELIVDEPRKSTVEFL